MTDPLYDEKPKKKKAPLPWWQRPVTVAAAAVVLVLALAAVGFALIPVPATPRVPTPTLTPPLAALAAAQPHRPAALAASAGRVVQAEVVEGTLRWRTVTVDPFSEAGQVLSIEQTGSLPGAHPPSHPVERVAVAADAYAFLLCDAAGCLLHAPQTAGERLPRHTTLHDGGALFATDGGTLMTRSTAPMPYRIADARPLSHLVLNAGGDQVAGAAGTAYFAGRLDEPFSRWIDTGQPIHDLAFTAANDLALLLPEEVRIDDLRGGQRSYALDPLLGEPLALVMSDDGASMAVVQREAVTVWPLATSGPLRPEASSSSPSFRTPDSPLAAVFLPGTRLMLVAYPGGRALAFDLDTHEVKAALPPW